MALVMNATWIAKPGEEEIVLDALRNLAPLSRAEPGNIYYQVYQDLAKPSVFRIFEIYTDQEAVIAHTQSPHFVRWATGRAIPALVERRREFYHTLDF